MIVVEPPWFREITEEVGLDFVHETGAQGELQLPEIMGSGVAFFDADRDGALDLYLVSSAFDLGADPALDGPANRFYRQLEDGTFEDATASSGLGDRRYGMGVAVGDVDVDGWLDVYVSQLGMDRLYRNLGLDAEGRVRFEDVTVAAGVVVDNWSASAAFLDFDRDGDLDLYVSRYVAYDPRVPCYDTTGQREYCGPTAFPGISDVLLRNDSAGGSIRFVDVSGAAGIDSVAAAGLGVAIEDFDGDGWVDVYVANDADPNQLWINQGNGTFVDEGLTLGASVNALGAAEAGMGVVAADLDGDSGVDLFMTHLENESNTLYRNLGQGLGFEDASAGSGLAISSSPYTGFGTAAFDVELDGDLDLVVANGRVLRGPLLPGELEAPWDDYAEPDLFYRNEGTAGAPRFELDEKAAGFLSRVEVSRGLAVGDVDRDGDLDLVVTRAQGPARLYSNEAPREGSWLVVEALDGGAPALGATVVLEAGGRSVRRSLQGGSSYLSSSEPVAHFGLGEIESVERLEVTWGDGSQEFFPVPGLDRRLVVTKGEGESP